MLLFALALQAAVPSAEAERLGVELAEQGILAALLPMIGARETDELVAAHPELNAGQRAELRRTATETLATGSRRLIAATGHQYALQLSVEDLRALIAASATDAARRYRVVQPQVIAGTMASVGQLDFTRDAAAAFCARTGKLCATR